MFATRMLSRPRVATGRKRASRDTFEGGPKIIEEPPRQPTVGSEQTNSPVAIAGVEPAPLPDAAPSSALPTTSNVIHVFGKASESTERQLDSALSAAGSFLLGHFQTSLVRRATAAAADAVVGSSAPASRRLLLRRGLRAAVAAVSILAFLLKLKSLLDSMTHLDSDTDLMTGAQAVLDIATSGPSLIEDCKDLMQLRLAAVSLGLARRDANISR